MILLHVRDPASSTAQHAYVLEYIQLFCAALNLVLTPLMQVTGRQQVIN